MTQKKNTPALPAHILRFVFLSLGLFSSAFLCAQETPPSIAFISTFTVAGERTEGVGIAVDGGGNSYVVSDIVWKGSILITKVSSGGSELWSRIYGTAQGNFLPADIAVDLTGAVYVVSTDYDTRSGLLIKYTTDGVFVKAQTLPFSGGPFYPWANDVIFDAVSGHIYVSETFTNPDKQYASDIAVMEYDTELNLLNTQVIDDAPDYDDSWSGLSSDAKGNVYVAGIWYSRARNTYQSFAVKYGPGLGALIFKTGTSARDTAYKEVHGIASDPAGNAYTVGINGQSAFISKVDGAGNLLFTKTFSSVGVNPYDYFWGVAADSAGNAYVVNNPWVNSKDSIEAIKYSPEGNILWEVRQFEENDYKWGSAISVDGNGNAYVAGGIWDLAANAEVAMVMKYAQGTAADTTPPAAVNDLTIAGVSTGTLTLSWTAPGDDGNTGTAAGYDLRYSTAGRILSDTDFSAALRGTGVPVPQPGGTPESVTLTGLNPGTSYYLALKTTDEAGNISGLSNSPSGKTSPDFNISISSGDAQIGNVNEPLPVPLEILIENSAGTPIPWNGIDFAISTFPAGAAGHTLSKSSDVTIAGGLADTVLTLGNIPADYGVTATCPDCVPEASTVTFKCCGKLKNDDFKQFDVRWSTYAYGAGVSSTIGGAGCALSALATLSNYYRATVSTAIPATDPARLNTYLEETGGYQNGTVVVWSGINQFSGTRINYIRDGSGDVNVLNTQTELLSRADTDILRRKPVVFRIRHRWPDGHISSHFIVAVGKCGDEYLISDPGDNTRIRFNPNDPDFLFVGIRRFAAQ